jgi:hypothetical protein
VDVDDDVGAVVGRAGEPQPQRLAHRRARTVAGDEPIPAQPVGSLRRFELELDPVVGAHQSGELRLPANLDQVWKSLGAVHENLLAHALLEVHHRREPLILVHRHLEPVHRHVAVVARAGGPGQRLTEHCLRDAEPVDDLQAAPRDARGADAVRHRVVGLDHHRAHAVAREPERERQPDRPAADDRDRVADRVAAVGETRQPERAAPVLEVLVVLQPARAAHAFNRLADR